VKLALVTGTLLLAVAAFTANPPDEPQASATKNSGTASQGAAKQSSMASPGTGTSSASKRKIPCKTPENVSLCYWTHGRLSFYIQHPPLRIWRIGTDRLLGVYSGAPSFPPRDTSELFLPELPVNLSRIYEDPANWEPPEEVIDPHVHWAHSIFADFEVCPLAPEKRGEMQPVCIDSAKNIFVQK
jgi:hypothetical protein